MDIWNVLLAVYLIVAGPALLMTWREQVSRGHRVLADRAAGLAACLAWPLVFPLVYAAARARA